MKRTSKTIILVMACIAAICGVVFLLHLVDTPPRFDFSNQFEDYLQKKIDNLDPNDKFTDLNIKEKERKLNDFFKLCERFILEDVIDKEIYNQKRLNYAGRYAQPFSMYCRTYFSESKDSWPRQNIARLEMRLNFLRNIPRFKEEYAEQYSLINTYCKIIRSYYEAENLLKQTKFKDLDLSRSRLHEAETHKSHDEYEYLKNNLDLISRLNQYPSKLNNAHVWFLEKQVDSLKEYKNYGKEDYKFLLDKVNAALADYRDKAQSVYGETIDISALEDKTSSLNNEANTYYNPPAKQPSYNYQASQPAYRNETQYLSVTNKWGKISQIDFFRDNLVITINVTKNQTLKNINSAHIDYPSKKYIQSIYVNHGFHQKDKIKLKEGDIIKLHFPTTIKKTCYFIDLIISDDNELNFRWVQLK